MYVKDDAGWDASNREERKPKYPLWWQVWWYPENLSKTIKRPQEEEDILILMTMMKESAAIGDRHRIWRRRWILCYWIVVWNFVRDGATGDFSCNLVWEHVFRLCLLLPPSKTTPGDDGTAGDNRNNNASAINSNTDNNNLDVDGLDHNTAHDDDDDDDVRRR